MVTTTVNGKRQSFYNQKLFNHDFSGQNLAHADFRCASVMGCNFSDTDLSWANFEGANCRGANFTAAKCYRTNFKDASLAQSIFEPKDAFGVTLTLNCATFDKMKVGRMWWFTWLMLALRMQVPEGEEEGELKIINVIGTKRYEGLSVLFGNRMI